MLRTCPKTVMTFGCLIFAASTSFAEFPWNPLSLIKGSKQDSAAEKPREITFETRRLIIQESQFYPPNQSQMFLASFESLNDEQAREKLNYYKSNRIRNMAGSSSTNQRGAAAAGTSRVAAGQSSPRSRVEHSPAPQTSRQTAGTVDLGSQSPWDRTRESSSTAGMSHQYPGSQANGIRYAEMQQTGPGQATGRNIIPSSYGRLPSALDRDPRDQPTRRGDDSAAYATPGNPFLAASYNHGFNPSARNDDLLAVVRPSRGASTEGTDFSANYRPAIEPPERTSPQGQFGRSPSSTRLNPSTRPGLDQLIDQAEAAVGTSHPGQSEQEYQAHVTRHVELRMLYLLAGRRDRALAAIPGIQPNEQEFWTRVFWSLSNYLDAQNYPDKAGRTAAALSQMRAAILSLQGNAPLAIDRAAFCTDIESFGNYTRFEKDEFTPGQEVLVYAELQNFQSERTPDGKHRTLLKSSVRLAQDGRAVDEVQYNATEDLSRSRRQDFMQGFRYQLPQRLAPGNYVLQLTIEDQLSSKSAGYSLNLRVR